jgi:hypothetical protein
MMPCLVDNGKNPDEPYNARLGFWLPTDSPYGNFQLKLMKLSDRVDEANRRLIESYNYWKRAREGAKLSLSLSRHILANEQAVYLLRRTADDLIALVWYLSEWEREGSYPTQISVDCIGIALKKITGGQLNVFKEHIRVLNALNEISNAFKHSFVLSNITTIGYDKPRVHALSLRYNKRDAGVKFHDISLDWLSKGFSAFYNDGMDWLRVFSENHR